MGGKKIVVGRVNGAHGVRGEIAVAPLTDYPERFHQMKSLMLYRDGEFVCELPIKSVRAHDNKRVFLVRSDRLQTRDEAMALGGCFVCVPEEERAPLPEGHYWIDDLIGLDVHEVETDRYLGKVRDVVRSGGNDLYWIDGADGREHFVPAAPDFIADICVPERRLLIRLIDGLWD
jgi:16S rRNA processing protein RimM